MRESLNRVYRSAYSRVVFGLVVSIVTLYLAFRNVNMSEVRMALSQADMRFIGLALLSVLINTVGKGIRWKVLLGKSGRNISVGKATMSLTVGHMLNTVFPARLGELSRAQTIGSIGPGRVFVFGTILVEKTLDMVSFALLFIILLFLIPLPAWVNESGYSFAGVALFITIVVLLVAFQRERVLVLLDKMSLWLPVRFRSFVGSHSRSGLNSLEVLEKRDDLLKLIFWSALIWGTAILNNFLTLLAIGIFLPVTASLLILIGLQAGISVVSIPGRIGIFEYICVLALAVFGISQSEAVSYGILLHMIVLLPGVIFGLIFIWFMGLGVKGSIELNFDTEEKVIGNQADKKNL